MGGWADSRYVNEALFDSGDDDSTRAPHAQCTLCFRSSAPPTNQANAQCSEPVRDQGKSPGGRHRNSHARMPAAICKFFFLSVKLARHFNQKQIDHRRHPLTDRPTHPPLSFRCDLRWRSSLFHPSSLDCYLALCAHSLSHVTVRSRVRVVCGAKSFRPPKPPIPPRIYRGFVN